VAPTGCFNPLERGMMIPELRSFCRPAHIACFNPLQWGFLLSTIDQEDFELFMQQFQSPSMEHFNKHWESGSSTATRRACFNPLQRGMMFPGSI
jgi:hypothetical protein